MAFPIPSMLLKQLYTFGSLKNSARGVEFQLKNRLSDATVTGVQAVAFDGVEVPLDADGARRMMRLVDALEDSDDVQNVWVNGDVSDEVAAELDADD